VGRAGGVVGGDEVDEAGLEGLPQLLAVVAGADGWGALGEGVAVADVFGGEVEIVGAGFDGEGKAFLSGGGDEWEGARGGEVDDVEAETMGAAEGDEEFDGFELGLVGA
jgi:hypothetical protein